MIATIVYYALAVNWLFTLPFYRNLTAPSDAAMRKLNGQRVPVWQRKPFNCLYCMSFWLASIGTVLIPALHGVSIGAIYLGIPAAASFLAVLINKLYNALPTSF